MFRKNIPPPSKQQIVISLACFLSLASFLAYSSTLKIASVRFSVIYVVRLNVKYTTKSLLILFINAYELLKIYPVGLYYKTYIFFKHTFVRLCSSIFPLGVYIERVLQITRETGRGIGTEHRYSDDLGTTMLR
jgi:hypothetical protein